MAGLGILGGGNEIKIIVKGVDDFSKTFNKAKTSIQALTTAVGIASKAIVLATGTLAAYFLKTASAINSNDIRVRQFNDSVKYLTNSLNNFSATVGTIMMEGLQPLMVMLYQNKEAFQAIGEVIIFFFGNLAKGISVVFNWVRALGNAIGTMMIFLQGIRDGLSVTQAWTRAQEVHQKVLEMDAQTEANFYSVIQQTTGAIAGETAAITQNAIALASSNDEYRLAIELRKAMTGVTMDFAYGKAGAGGGGGGSGGFEGEYVVGPGGGIAFVPKGGSVTVTPASPYGPLAEGEERTAGSINISTASQAGIVGTAQLQASASTSTVTQSTGAQYYTTSGFGSSGGGKKGGRYYDASLLVTPTGVHEFDPGDTILARKNGGFGSANIIVNVYGSLTTWDKLINDVDKALMQKLRNKVTIGT